MDLVVTDPYILAQRIARLEAQVQELQRLVAQLKVE